MSEPSGPGVCCIVLAAGRGQRFGSDKRRARLPDTRPLLSASLAQIPDVFSRRLLVLHSGDEDLARAYPDWQSVFAEQASLGMGYSLAAGLRACGECQAALVALGDMPEVSPDSFAQLAAAAAPERLVVPRYQGRRGNPVVIGREFFRELLSPGGDSGARALFRTYPEAVHYLDCDDPGILLDIDTPADLPSG